MTWKALMEKRSELSVAQSVHAPPTMAVTVWAFSVSVLLRLLPQ